MDWTSFPSGPGVFSTMMGDNIKPNILRQSAYRNQNVVPMSFNQG